MKATSFDIENTLGAASIGFAISCFLFGVLTTQVFAYFQRYYLDRPLYKFVVALLWLMELLDQIFIGYSVYFYTIKNYNNPRVIAESDIIWTLIVQIILGCFVGTVVKCCFTMRVWRFSKQNLFISGGIITMIVGQLGLALLYCIKAFQLNKFSMANKLRVVASLALGAGVATDFVIAAALCWFLHKLRTGFRRSNTIINTLVTYAVGTGALTATLALCTIILYNARPDTFFYIASYFNLGKLYAISFLSTLNTRKVIRGRGTDHQGEPAQMVALSSTHQHTPRTPKFPPSSRKGMEIGMHKEVSVIDDLEKASEDPTYHQ